MNMPRLLIAFVALGLFSTLSPAAAEDNPLVGTWKMKSMTRDGMTVEVPDTVNIYKHVTPSHFAGVTYDNDGKFIRSHGGTYVKKGDEYIETVEYTSFEGTRNLIGKESKFTWKLDGDKWVHKGTTAVGFPIDELWVKVK